MTAATSVAFEKFLGKKGEITAILKQMGKLSAEERPVIGQMTNDVRVEIEAAIAAFAEKAKAAELASKLAKGSK